MDISHLSDESMRSALRQLEQAVYNHDQWAEMLYGTLICRSEPDERDTDSEAHRRCRFGQWYYNSGVQILGQNPGFAEIGLEHERMHQFARELLRASVEGTQISIREYERFVSALKRLRLEIDTLHRELQDALFKLDPLTGIPSRLGMLTKLREQQELVIRKARACTVAMMDLDHFKAVNDTYGHAAGDKVLVNMARYATTHLRPYDKIFRYGGEEFLICLPDTDLATGRQVLERLREELASLSHEPEGQPALHVTASFGLALLEPDLPIERSIDRADKALYAAKMGGRNAVLVWDAEMDAGTAESRKSA